MNNEPVAWMQIFENQNKERKLVLNFDRIGKNDIPLYTHQAKTLTDEEIYALWEEFNGEIKNFARAILRKAQEK